ncbi:phosphate ABC transporter ATP-binding protein [Anaerosolibacter sp.]|uniref:ABC transporter ATP-binding protein n=1 Tax=Anaerosolibacter sp. TaxID=1872527 RepID=UPI0039EEF421
MESIFKINNLSKAFKGKKVLCIDELNIPRGLITAIIGPSGAGKSTLLSILNGLVPPDEGKIFFEDQNIIGSMRHGDHNRRSMAMVFQHAVMFHGTVFDNIAYGLKIRKTPEDQIKKRVDEILALIGLNEIALQRAETISGGEAQRIALARAMVFQPKVLLLDEPTANLDPANVSQIEKLIVHAKREYGTTVVLVTHNMFQAKRLADYTVFMMNGSIIECGNHERIFENPNDAKTRLFISGEMIY